MKSQLKWNTREGNIEKVFEGLKEFYPKAAYNKYSFRNDEGKNKIYLGYYDLLPGFEVSVLKSVFNQEIYYDEYKDEKWIIIKFLKNKTTIDTEKKTLTFGEFGEVDEVVLYNTGYSLDTVVPAGQYVELVSVRLRFDVLFHYTTLSDLQLMKLHDENKRIIVHERMLPHVKSCIDAIFKYQDSDEGVIGLSTAKSLEVITLFLLQVKHRFTETSDYGISDYNYNQMIEIRNFLINDLSENVEIKELIKKFGVSHANLHRNFKKVFGTSPHQFVKKARIDKAYNMLINSDVSIVEIVDELGFTHSSHFTNSFKKEFGITPKQLRKSHQITLHTL